MMVNKGEYVFRTGETAEEIFFVLEGNIYITDPNESKVFAEIKKNDFFGQMEIISGQIGIRSVRSYKFI